MQKIAWNWIARYLIVFVHKIYFLKKRERKKERERERERSCKILKLLQEWKINKTLSVRIY